MKTAIQQLIDALEKQIVYSAQGKGDTIRTGDYRIGLRKAINIASNFLETEKTLSKDCFVEKIILKDGYRACCGKEMTEDAAEQYCKDVWLKT
jgi:hypothetical protein